MSHENTQTVIKVFKLAAYFLSSNLAPIRLMAVQSLINSGNSLLREKYPTAGLDLDYHQIFCEIINLASETNELTAHIILASFKCLNKMCPLLVVETAKRLSKDILTLFYKHQNDAMISQVVLSSSSRP